MHISNYITPVMYVDSSGNFVVISPIFIKKALKIYTSIKNVFKKIKEDMNNISVSNDSEKAVLESNYFSFYKGSLVIRHNIPDTTSCAIFHRIFLNKNESEVATVKHEWGHTQQERILGTPLYIIRVVIPSLYGYFNTPYDEYYSQPWEYSADILGGVNRKGYAYSISAEEALEYTY